MVKAMEAKVREMSNRARFIQEVVDNSIDLRKMADDEATDVLLLSKQYDNKTTIRLLDTYADAQHE